MYDLLRESGAAEGLSSDSKQRGEKKQTNETETKDHSSSEPKEIRTVGSEAQIYISSQNSTISKAVYLMSLT